MFLQSWLELHDIKYSDRYLEWLSPCTWSEKSGISASLGITQTLCFVTSIKCSNLPIFTVAVTWLISNKNY